MRVMVLGAGGQLGRALIAILLRRNVSVTAFVRQAAPGQVPQEATLFTGDARNENDVFRALSTTNPDAVVNVVSAGTLKGNTVESDATAATLKAIRQTAVKRYIGMSTPMVVTDRLIMKVLRATLLRHLCREDQKVEELIRASDLDWTIVRAPRLTNDTAKGAHASTSAPRHVFSISRLDVAEFIFSALAERSYVRQTPFVY
jgi:uncharacterized protein YbjT (DUF2867 family)